jgi:long-chain acyl-CoA synthetase
MSDEGSDKIAIISNNRPEWLFTDMAVQQTGRYLFQFILQQILKN